MKKAFIRLFNTEPTKSPKTPLKKNDHPELDTTNIIERQQVNHYLIMLGQLQWLVTFGRFDIQDKVIPMFRFTAEPRQQHLERLQRIYANVIRTKDYATRFVLMEPDYSYLPEQNFYWTYTVYGDVQEIIPQDIPDPLRQNCAYYYNSGCKSKSLLIHLDIFNWLFTLCKPYSHRFILKKESNSGNCYICVRSIQNPV